MTFAEYSSRILIRLISSNMVCIVVCFDFVFIINIYNKSIFYFRLLVHLVIGISVFMVIFDPGAIGYITIHYIRLAIHLDIL